MSRPTPEPRATRSASPADVAARWLERFRLAPLLLRREGVWDGQQAWPSFEAWCAAHAGHGCTLSVSSTLLHELVCDEDLPLADDAAALAWARPLLQHFHGDAARTWPLAAWQDGSTRGVSALHGVRMDALLASARQHRVQLQALRPWWALALQLALQRQRSLGRGPARLLVLEGACLTDLVLLEGQVRGVQIRRLDAATPQALQAWCEAHPLPGIAVTVGYGLSATPDDDASGSDALDAPAPPVHWLSGRQA